MEKLKRLCIAGGDVKWCSCFPEETVWQFLKKLNIELPCDPEILFLNIYPKELKADTQTDTCKPVFMAALFTKPENRNHPNVHQQMNG